MAKKCIMCGEEAKYWIKDTSDYYCEECAKDSFNDISALIKVEEQAQRLKEAIKERMNLTEEEKKELDKKEKETTEKQETSEEVKKEETVEEVSEEKE